MWNEALGWACILAGMITGALGGLRFQREDWLGGYGSHPRRLLRLGHVALIALGMLNILFVLALERLELGETALLLAGFGLAVGAVTMPLCCLLAALGRRSPLLFTVPVTALLTGVVTTFWGLVARLLEAS